MMTHVFRLHPGDDLRLGIEAYVQKHRLKAAVIVSCVGSLSHVRLRDASGVNIRDVSEAYEIVSATGTAGMERTHIHIRCSREDLLVIGGHLTEGCIIKTTAEVALLELDGLRFGKVFDEQTGYHELNIIREA